MEEGLGDIVTDGNNMRCSKNEPTFLCLIRVLIFDMRASLAWRLSGVFFSVTAKQRQNGQN